MIDIDKHNLAVRLLEEAADKGAHKGLRAEDMLQGMLSIYVCTRLGLAGLSVQDVLAEVQAVAEAELRSSDATYEVGPALGKGNN